MRTSLGMIKLVSPLGLAVAIVLGGVIALTSAPTATARPEPDCGPDFSWDCTMPDGTHQYVEGTRCDIARFQRETGARCVMGGGL
jgi:hypothetical protein